MVYKNLEKQSMKKIITTVLISFLLIIGPFFSGTLLADAPPDPGTGGPGTGDVPVGGGSPVGSGLILLISMGAVYGFKKVFKSEKD